MELPGERKDGSQRGGSVMVAASAGISTRLHVLGALELGPDSKEQSVPAGGNVIAGFGD